MCKLFSFQVSVFSVFCPAFCVKFEADVSNFKRMVKEQGLSFTLAMVYAVCKCANKIEAFRYRFVDGQVVLYDRIDTAFTYLNKETNTTKPVTPPSSGTTTKPSTNTSNSGYYVYTVKKGDSWWAITARECGSGAKYKKLQQYNNWPANKTLLVGAKIKIPYAMSIKKK